MRRSGIFALFMAVSLLLFVLMLVDAHHHRLADLPLIESRAATVKAFQLTDLCLFTEARYARHLSQADLHAAFQDHPMSLEHFPAGSLAPPPKRTRASHENVD